MGPSIGVGVIGLGFMGGVHLRAFDQAATDGIAVETIAVWDHNEERRRLGGAGVRGNITSTEDAPLFDPLRVRVDEDLASLLGDASIDLVSICTPTDTHAELITRALDAGKHVLVEKPVALESEVIRTLAREARAADRIVMPAMCMRFWPGWRWLKERIDDRELGELLSLTLVRIGAPPSWSSDFYLDPSRSGDAIVDLHIHDADCVRWLFGMPNAVSSVGSPRHLSTAYTFNGGPAMVVAEGGWMPTPSAPFQMSYRACFERGVATFDIQRDPWLVLHTAGEVEHPEIPTGDGYDGEIRHLVAALAAGRAPEANLDEAAEVMDLIAFELESLRTGAKVTISS